MAFDAVAQTMIHWMNLKVDFVHSERPLNKPQIVVVGYHLFIRQLRVCHISFESVPDSVVLKRLKVDAYGCLALKTEVFIVATVVDVLLAYLSRCPLR